MSDEEERKPDGVESSLEEMKIEGDMSDEEGSDTRCVRGVKEESLPSTPQPASFSHERHTSEFIKRPPTSDSQSSTTSNKSSPSSSSTHSDVHEETIGGEISITVEPGKTPKLARTSTKTMAFKPPTLFDHFPDETEEATSHFEVIRDCIYGSKYMGSSDHDALGCDCNSEFDGKKNRACGEDSDCINRATKMECIDDECSCGAGCQNQRFQRKQFAKVSVIKTEKKGYGLRADTELRPADFIYEYIGEVINENHFRRRMVQYDEEGIKHFYFMSLSKGEFVDATKKGNLGRFCNHSCNPNCYVDKWVVGEKLRMGIFALRSIEAGEELVFNYNVDRYGADPQPCYCGEPNCTGFLGGKTQTERATKLPTQTIEALGIDDGDGWDTAVAKRPRKKKTGEDDEEYVNNLQPKALDERGATKVMATLMQCKEKWIAVKLLGRIQACEEDSVRHQVIRMHGYQILKSTLATFHDDVNVVLQVLQILHTLPRLTRNKILDSKIESSIEPLVNSEDERVASQASTLMKDWAALEMGYRIPRKAKDATDSNLNLPRHNIERRDYDNFQPRQKSPTPEPPKGPAAPKGPRNSAPQRAPFPNGPRAGFPSGPGFQRPMTLPAGWQMAKAANGKPYFFSVSGLTQWTRPYQADRNPPPPPPPPPVSNEKKLQDIIDNITKEAKAKPKVTPVETPPPVVEVPKEKRKDKWKSLPKEKQMKIYENTLFPHIHYVMNKYKNKLPREDIKRFGKELAKKLVNSDYKNDRVKDPNQISSSQVKQVKSYVKTFFDKAVVKRAEHDKKKAAQAADSAQDSKKSNGPSPDTPVKSTEMNGEEKMDLSDEEVEVDDGKSTPLTTPSNPVSNGTNGIKRKRDEDEESETGSVKRKRDEANVSETGGIKCKAEEDGVSATASPKRKRELSEEGTPDSGSTPTKRQRSISPGFPPPPPPPMDGIDMVTGFQTGGIMASTIDEEVAFMDAPPPPPIEEGQQFEEEVPGMENFAEGQVIQTSSAFLPASTSDISHDLADSESPSDNQKNGLADHFEGMNHERLRQLGVPSEA